MTPARIGRSLRRKRRQIGLRQAELAAVANVGPRFVSELENGKPTLEIGRVLKVLEAAGLEVFVEPRSWKTVLSDHDE